MEEEKRYEIDGSKYFKEEVATRRQRRQQQERMKQSEKKAKRWIAAGLATMFTGFLGIGTEIKRETKPTEFFVEENEQFSENMKSSTFELEGDVIKATKAPIVPKVPTSTIPSNVTYESFTEQKGYFTKLIEENKENIYFTISQTGRIIQLSNSKNNYGDSNSLYHNAICGYEEFEELLASKNPEDENRLIEYGSAFLIKFSRNLVKAYIADLTNSSNDTIKATYEKQNDEYYFYIRKEQENNVQPLAKVIGKKNQDHLFLVGENVSRFPEEVYESLIYIGEMSNCLLKDDNNQEINIAIDLANYAKMYTNGDQQKAKTEVHDRLIQEYQRLQTLSNDILVKKTKDKQAEERQ